ncbi:hypothetical protein NDN08_005772 [Rhodosorus marinus]|uniref:Calmodulin n=1 Tax=Rhodosorus marinus TaxID=101924 RepID=A0AAV8V2K7_9RHOD|nr:hypothetical protein NDN08_005772 [Rhodosorus marinus]
MGGLQSKISHAEGGDRAEGNPQRKMTLEEVRLMRDLFNRMGVKGQMNKGQLGEVLEALGADSTPPDVLFELFDINNDGSVMVKEFIECLSVLLYGSPEDTRKFLFNFYDKNGDGHIDRDELVRTFELLRAVGSGYAPQDSVEDTHELAEKALRMHDFDMSGGIDFTEFEHMIKTNETTLKWMSSLSDSTRSGFTSLRTQNEDRLVMLELERLLDDEGDEAEGEGNLLRRATSEFRLSIRGSKSENMAQDVSSPVTESGMSSSFSMNEIITRNALRHQDSIGKFRVPHESLQFGKILGSGAHAVVYEGEWLNLPVAIKVVKEETRSRLASFEEQGENAGDQFEDLLNSFENELKVLGDLRHPNIMLYMGAVVEPGKPLCIVTELMSGGSLFSLLQKEDSPVARMDTAGRLKIMLEICRGVLYLHSREPPILHRDLKSENVLIDTATGRAVVGDFGLSSRLAADETFVETGTAVTMAPEVIDGEAYMEAADVYSLSIIMWEVLTGRVPYVDMPATAILVKVSMDGLRPEFLSEDQEKISPNMKEMMMQMWQEDPSSRPSIADCVARIIKELEVLKSG